MSVPVGKRKESGIEFLKNARDIEEIVIDIRINKPKRYIFFYDKLLDIAFDILTEVKTANSIYPENQEEVKARALHFKEAIGLCQALNSQIEVLYHKLKNDAISIGQVQSLAQMITNEIRLIKGSISSDKFKYVNIDK